MDPLVRTITTYFQDIQHRSNLQDYKFTSDEKFAGVALETLRSGTLPPDITDRFFRTGGRGQTKNQVDVVVSLVTLQNRGRKEGLLLLPASLTRDGKLAADPGSAEPWIPSSRLTTPGVPASGVTVGELSDFWDYRLTEWTEAVPQLESWSDTVNACLEMFDAVVSDDFGEIVAANRTTVLRDECFLSAETVITANGAVLDLYGHLLSPETKVRVPAYEQLLSPGNRPRGDSDTIDDGNDLLLRNALASCGSMSDGFPLTPSQRRAVHAYLTDPDKGVTAVSGPPGTGKTTMLQSVVASTLVRHALDDRPAPLIVCTSTNNQAVTNVIDSFNSVAKDEPSPLDQRWLPLAAPDSDSGATPEPLSALATYCPSRSKAKDATAEGYLTENIKKTGVYSVYSAPDYVATATARLLEQMQTYAASTHGVVAGAKTLSEATDILRSILRHIDRNRCTLLTEKAGTELARGPRESLRLAEEIRIAEEQREPVLERKNFWDARMRDAETADRDPDREAFLIDLHYRDDEPARRYATLDEFTGFYARTDAALAQRIGDLDTARQQAEQREAAASALTEEGERALQKLRYLNAVTDEGAQQIRDAVSLLDLDRCLDTTVRYAEFWIAVHLYEAQWLTFASDTESDDRIIPVRERNRTTPDYMKKYWRQVAALTPCFVMTAYQLPRYFKLYTGKEEKTDFDLERADLLIMDESGQVDTSVGAAAFSLAKRALVVGDVNQLAPVWSIDPESDRQIATVDGLTDDQWQTMTDHGLTSSDHSSVMAAAAAASNWTYGEDREPGLFLSEHFRCHPDIINYCNALLYKGMLVPSRPLKGYKLADRTVSPFLFFEVPGSEDRKSGSSRVNAREATAIAQWITDNYSYFADIYGPAGASPGEIIGVVTPFAAQARLILQKIGDIGGRELQKKITVGTAHRLQGAERPVVLFSSVYGDRSSQASFIDSTLELMNVAVSRAKDLFIVFGGTTRRTDQGPVFSLVKKYAMKSDCDFSGHGAARAVPEEPVTVEPAAPAAPATPAAPEESTATVRSTDPVETSAPMVPDDPGYRTVERTEPGYAIASGLVADLVPPSGSDRKPTAKALNAALEKAGYIERADGHWIPTATGTTLGIAVYEGTSPKDGSTYLNLIYSPEARRSLSNMVARGGLVL